MSSTQIPHIAKVTLSGVTGIDERKLRVVAPDVGGGFGSKLNVYAEEALALGLAKKLGVPVKWIEERAENYVATTHGRGGPARRDARGRRGREADRDEVRRAGGHGRVLPAAHARHPRARRVGCTWAPTTRRRTGTSSAAWSRTRHPTDAYRGAGRPEATYVVERAMDALARKVGKDPAEVRRINLHAPFDEATPFICGLSVDSRQLRAAAGQGARAGRLRPAAAGAAARRERPGDVRQLGIGLTTYIEMCGLAPSNILGALRYAAGGWDGATIECLPLGRGDLEDRNLAARPGPRDLWAQIVADGLGVDPDKVTVLHGDTMITPLGMDTYGSRSVSVGGVGDPLRDGEGEGEGADDRGARARGLRGRSGVDRRLVPVKGAPDKARTIPEIALSAWHAHALPDGVEPSLHATADLRPEELHVARRARTPASSRSIPRPGTPTS